METIHGRQMVVPVPFSFAAGVAARNQEVMQGLSAAFASYAAAVRRRWIFRSAAGPLVADEYQCARDTADLLGRFARHRRLDGIASVGKLRGRWLALPSSTSPFDRMRLVTWPDMQSMSKSLIFPALGVSYVPYRVVRPGSPGERNAPPRMKLHVVPEMPHESTMVDREFDGIMTRLHGEPGYRIEMDPHSGRQKLHLCLSETSFLAFMATQWREKGAEDRGVHAYRSRLLSVNLFLVDDSERVVLVRRHPSVTHGGRFAGAASAACEVIAREGIPADVDSHGLPDPLVTLRREAREELGLDIAGREWKLGVIGLIEVEAPRDLGTYVLHATARLPYPATDFKIDPGSTDDLEGTWELGADVMVVDLRGVLESSKSLREFVTWLRADPVVLPHGVGGLLLMIVARLELRHYANEKIDHAAISDLAMVLSERPLDVPPEQPSTVTIHDLWRLPGDSRRSPDR